LTEVRIEATRPLLQKDATGTTRFLSADDIQKLPTRGYKDAAAQQTGVVNFQKQIDVESSNSPTLIVRGGRPNETAYYVDGFSQQDPLTGTSSTAINNDAIQEVVLLTGGFAPEYGRVMSGAVNVITREGGKKYSGGLEGVTDALAGNWIGANKTDYNIYGANLGGPLFPKFERLTFYASGERRWQRDRSPGFISDVTKSFYEAHGLSGDHTPMNSSSSWIYQGKLAYQLTDKMTLRGGALGSKDDWREYLHPYLLDLAHTPRYEDLNQSYFATFNHVISNRTYWNLGFNWNDTQRKRGDGVYFDDLSKYYISPNPRFDQEVPLFYRNGHVWDDYLQRHSSYYGVQAAYTSQVDAHNQIKAGGDFQRHTLRFFDHYFPTRLGGDTPDLSNWDGYGYDIRVHYDAAGIVDRVDLVENDDNAKDGPKHPKTWALFAQDKYEREGVIVNGGLRFDYINVDTPALKDDRAPLISGEYPD